MVNKKPDKNSVKGNTKSTHKNKKPNPNIFESYDDKNRAEWNKKRGQFEEIADELSKDNDFILLTNDKLREKFIRKNYHKPKEVKALVERAMELYRIRVKKFSI